MADISFDHDELRDIAYGIKDDLLQELKDEVTDQIENEIMLIIKSQQVWTSTTNPCLIK